MYQLCSLSRGLVRSVSHEKLSNALDLTGRITTIEVYLGCHVRRIFVGL